MKKWSGRKASAVLSAALIASSPALTSCSMLAATSGGAAAEHEKRAVDTSCATGTGVGSYAVMDKGGKQAIRDMIGVAKHMKINKNGQYVAAAVMIVEVGPSLPLAANDGKDRNGSWPGSEPDKAFWLNYAKTSLQLPHSYVGSDADSVGYYQQRASAGWANGGGFTARGGDPKTAMSRLMSPVFSSWTFFGRPGSGARGMKQVPGYESMDPGALGQAIQGSAFPAKYGRVGAQARALVDANQDAPPIDPSSSTDGGSSSESSSSSSSSSSPASADPVALSCGGSAGAGDPGVAQGTAKDIIEAGKKYLGTPYVWGGGSLTGPSTGTCAAVQPNACHISGLDCSGFTRLMVYQGTKKSIELPRTADQQYRATHANRVPWDKLQPGDLMFWGSEGNIHHVAIYLGQGMMMHEPNPAKKAEIVPAYKADFVSGTRLQFAK